MDGFVTTERELHNRPGSGRRKDVRGGEHKTGGQGRTIRPVSR
jgi:hypothetical protein